MAPIVLRRLQTWSRFPWQPGATLLAELVADQPGSWLAEGRPEVVATYTLAGPLGNIAGAEDKLEFALPLTSALVPHLVERRLLAVVMTDGAGGEAAPEWWRVRTCDPRRAGLEPGALAVTCSPVLHDLTDCGAVADTATPVAKRAGRLAAATVADAWAILVAPRLAATGNTHITLGTVAEPDREYDWPYDNTAPLALLAETVGGVGFDPAEVRLRYDHAAAGAARFLFDVLPEGGVGAELNGGAPVPVTKRSGGGVPLREIARAWDVATQATRASVQGAPVNETATGLDAITLVVHAYTPGAAPVLTLADPEGEMAPVTRAGQYVGGAVRRLRSGRCFAITASAPAAQLGTFTLAVEPGTPFAVGERVELVTTAATDTAWSDAGRIALPANVATIGGVGPRTLTGVDWVLGAPGGTTGRACTITPDLTLHPVNVTIDAFAESLADPGDVVDLRAEVWRQIATVNYAYDADGLGSNDDATRITGALATTLQLRRSHYVSGVPTETDVPLPVGTQVGDLVVLYRIERQLAYAVLLETLDAGRIVFTGRHPIPGVVQPFDGSTDAIQQCRIYRRQPAFPRIEAFDAATRTVTVDSAAGLAADDRVLLHRLPEPLQFLDEVVDPSAEAAYGVKATELRDTTVAGVRNLIGGGWFRSARWTGSPAMPAGSVGAWTLVTGTAPTKSTAPEHVHLGGAALRFDANATVQSPVARHWFRSTEPMCAIAVWYGVFGEPDTTEPIVEPVVVLQLYDYSRPIGGVGPTLLGTYTVPANRLTYNGLAVASLDGIAITSGCRDVALRIQVATEGRVVVVAGAMVTPTPKPPTTLVDESGCNALAAAALDVIAARRSARAAMSSIPLRVRDTYREDPAAYPTRRLGVGMRVAITEAQTGFAADVARVWRHIEVKSRADVARLEAGRRLPTLAERIARSLASGTAPAGQT